MPIDITMPALSPTMETDKATMEVEAVRDGAVATVAKVNFR